MSLYFIYEGGPIKWNPKNKLANSKGETVTLPPNIEQIMSDEELAEYGLYRVPDAATPGPGQEITSNKVMLDNGIPVRQVLYRDIPVTAEHIKAEAGRRIVALMPEYKQRNALAQGMEVLLAAVLDGVAPTEEQKAEVREVLAIWAGIKAIRKRSNELEVDPPKNFASDINWS